MVRKQKHNVPKAQLKGSYQSGGRILPVMAYTGRLRAKGVRFSFFQALGICKGGDFSIRRISTAAIINEKDVSMIRREGYSGKEKKILNLKRLGNYVLRYTPLASILLR